MAMGMSCTLSARLVAVTTISSSCCAAIAGARPTVSAAIMAASGFGEYLRGDVLKLPLDRVLVMISVLLSTSDEYLFYRLFLFLSPCTLPQKRAVVMTSAGAPNRNKWMQVNFITGMQIFVRLAQK
jgi:hypothetical protein